MYKRQAQEIADKMAALKRPVVIWLQLQECTGCLESTIRSYNEDLGDMVLSAVSMPYVELLMAPSGEAALSLIHIPDHTDTSITLPAPRPITIPVPEFIHL